MPDIRVAIVMPVFNNLALTRKALDAVYANTPAALSWRLLLVDNGSSDGTEQELPRDSRMTIIRNEENTGFAQACNLGAWEADSDYLVFLNNDTEVQPGWLEALLDELDGNPVCGIAGARLLYPNGKIQHAGVAVMQNLLPGHMHRNRAANDPLVMERREVFALTGACIALRRREFFNLDCFDEGYVNGYEDTDLCMRYREAGYKLVYRPDCVAIHHEGQTEGRQQFEERNRKRFLSRWRLAQDDFRYMARDIRQNKAPLRFAIKICCPVRKDIHWGDILIAEGLAKELVRRGHDCQVHYLNEWNSDDRDIDVVIHLTGLSPYRTKPWNINLMWMISHPDMHPLAELEKYDALCVASNPYAAHLSSFCRKPVFPLLQAADPEVFMPAEAGADLTDVIFIGNNGGTGRPAIRTMVDWLLPQEKTELPPFSCGVYGTGWDGFINPAHIRGYCYWKMQADIYRNARLILNDHHGDMAENGFVNDRTYQIALCGKPFISDRVKGLADLLDVPEAGSRGELRELVAYCLANPREMAERAAKNRALALENFTYQKRAAEIEAIVRKLDTPDLRKRLARAY